MIYEKHQKIIILKNSKIEKLIIFELCFIDLTSIDLIISSNPIFTHFYNNRQFYLIFDSFYDIIKMYIYIYLRGSKCKILLICPKDGIQPKKSVPIWELAEIPY